MILFLFKSVVFIFFINVSFLSGSAFADEFKANEIHSLIKKEQVELKELNIRIKNKTKTISQINQNNSKQNFIQTFVFDWKANCISTTFVALNFRWLLNSELFYLVKFLPFKNSSSKIYFDPLVKSWDQEEKAAVFSLASVSASFS